MVTAKYRALWKNNNHNPVTPHTLAWFHGPILLYRWCAWGRLHSLCSWAGWFLFAASSTDSVEELSGDEASAASPAPALLWSHVEDADSSSSPVPAHQQTDIEVGAASLSQETDSGTLWFWSSYWVHSLVPFIDLTEWTSQKTWTQHSEPERGKVITHLLTELVIALHKNPDPEAQLPARWNDYDYILMFQGQCWLLHMYVPWR